MCSFQMLDMRQHFFNCKHLRMLHDLRADAEGVQPLLESRTQLGSGHGAVLARGRDCVGGSAWHPERLRRKCQVPGGTKAAPEPQGRRCAEVAAPSWCASPCRSPKTPWRQPCSTCRVPYLVSHRREAPSFS